MAAVSASAQLPVNRPTPATELGSNLPAQTLGPNDLIGLSVYEAPELSRSIRVGADGYIRIPMLKQKTEGRRTPTRRVGDGDRRGAGEGEHPCRSACHGHHRGIPKSANQRHRGGADASRFPGGGKACYAAGGHREGTGIARGCRGRDSRLQHPARRRRQAPTPDPAHHRARSVRRWRSQPKHSALRRRGGPRARSRQDLRRWKRQKAGRISRSGGSETTVLQMLALAEGLEKFASDQAYIYRREAAGPKNEIPIQLKKILDRKSPDVPLVANDILYVPDNSGKRRSASAMEKILLFGTTAGATALIYGWVR